MLNKWESKANIIGYWQYDTFELYCNNFKTINYDEGRESMVPSTMRIVFGIIMIIVYVGMGVLLLINFFDWHTPLLTWLRWIGGILFIIYGIWRAIRQFWGIDSSI